MFVTKTATYKWVFTNVTFFVQMFSLVRSLASLENSPVLGIIAAVLEWKFQLPTPCSLTERELAMKRRTAVPVIWILDVGGSDRKIQAENVYWMAYGTSSTKGHRALREGTRTDLVFVHLFSRWCVCAFSLFFSSLDGCIIFNLFNVGV